MASQLEQLKTMTTVVADTGDMESIKIFSPQDCTTNPTLIYKAAQMPQYGNFVQKAIVEGEKLPGDKINNIVDLLSVTFGVELTRYVPGRVSTEVDARLSFNTQATILKAKRLIDFYKQNGIGSDRILIKIAATWEGIQAAKQLEDEGINCNLTLLFGMPQAIACAQAGAHLISPFVGRILDWHKVKEQKEFTPTEDPGVLSVKEIYNVYKSFGVETIIMGASFRNIGEILELAGCDRLTISTALLKELSETDAPIERKLSPENMALVEDIKNLDIDEKLFRWQMCKNAMATEKLMEGIRNFDADSRKLKELVNSMI